MANVGNKKVQGLSEKCVTSWLRTCRAHPGRFLDGYFCNREWRTLLTLPWFWLSAYADDNVLFTKAQNKVIHHHLPSTVRTCYSTILSEQQVHYGTIITSQTDLYASMLHNSLTRQWWSHQWCWNCGSILKPPEFCFWNHWKYVFVWQTIKTTASSSWCKVLFRSLFSSAQQLFLAAVYQWLNIMSGWQWCWDASFLLDWLFFFIKPFFSSKHPVVWRFWIMGCCCTLTDKN